MHTHSSKRIGCWLFMGLSVSVTCAQLRTLTLTSAHDNTLYEDAGGALSNGSGEHFFTGRSGAGLRRGLLSFDLTPLPRSALVLEAHLFLNVSRVSGGESTIELHRVLSDWGEGASDASGEEGSGAPAAVGDATWLHRFFDDVFWSAVGGDFDPTASGAQVVSVEGQYEWTSQQMAYDVQEWSLNRAANFGWAVLGDEQIGGSAKRFDTRENPIPANRPRLEVQYFLRCPWDLDQSGVVELNDLALLLTHFGTTSGAGPLDGDVDDDGDVDLADLAALLSWFGRVCPP
jgi:hypothetical protein